MLAGEICSLPIEARSSKASWLAVMSIISSLVIPEAGGELEPPEDVTSFCCGAGVVLRFVVDTTLLLLLFVVVGPPLLKVMDKFVVPDAVEAVGEAKFRSVTPLVLLLLLLEDSTGSIVREGVEYS